MADPVVQDAGHQPVEADPDVRSTCFVSCAIEKDPTDIGYQAGPRIRFCSWRRGVANPPYHKIKMLA